MRLFGVILAGGEGRRMGGADKALLPLAGRSLLAHVRDRLEPQVEALALSANGDAARFAGFGLPVLTDAAPQGPLSGVLAALDWAAAQGADAVVSASVDTPFLPGDLVPQLWLAGDGGLAVAECGGRLHPTCALWPVDLRDDLRGWLASGEAKV
ncbi:MAG: molybdenum cofactor guanylyltransferase MobA, partial [Cereibacter changlensis]